MSFEYTLDKVSKLGDYDETYGQRYWCESPDEEKALSFNSREDIELTEDSGAIHIAAEERTEKQSKKGTVYYQLKKVKVSGSQGRGETSPPATKGPENPQNAADVYGTVTITPVQLAGLIENVQENTEQLDRIEAMLYNALGNTKKPSNPEEMPY